MYFLWKTYVFFLVRVIAWCLTPELSQRPTGDPERRRREVTETWRQDICLIHNYST